MSPICSTEAWLCPAVDQPRDCQRPKCPKALGRQQRRTPPGTPRRRRTVERRPPERQRKRRGVVFSLPMQPRERQVAEVGDLATHGFDTLSRRLCYPRRRSRDCDTQDWIPVVGGNVSHYLSPLGSSRQSETRRASLGWTRWRNRHPLLR